MESTHDHRDNSLHDVFTCKRCMERHFGRIFEINFRDNQAMTNKIDYKKKYSQENNGKTEFSNAKEEILKFQGELSNEYRMKISIAFLQNLTLSLIRKEKCKLISCFHKLSHSYKSYLNSIQREIEDFTEANNDIQFKEAATQVNDEFKIEYVLNVEYKEIKNLLSNSCQTDNLEILNRLSLYQKTPNLTLESNIPFINTVLQRISVDNFTECNTERIDKAVESIINAELKDSAVQTSREPLNEEIMIIKTNTESLNLKTESIEDLQEAKNAKSKKSNISLNQAPILPFLPTMFSRRNLKFSPKR